MYVREPGSGMELSYFDNWMFVFCIAFNNNIWIVRVCLHYVEPRFTRIPRYLQGPQSLSVISNLVLTDRKKAINIKIMVNPVKGRWEISYGTTKIQKKITYGSQFSC